MLRLSLLTVFCCLCLEVFAGYSSGKVTAILVKNNQTVFVTSENKFGSPACQSVERQWAIDISTSSGRSQYSMILLAYFLEKPIVIVGNQTCSIWPDRETVDHMWIQ